MDTLQQTTKHPHLDCILYKTLAKFQSTRIRSELLQYNMIKRETVKGTHPLNKKFVTPFQGSSAIMYTGHVPGYTQGQQQA